MGLLRLLPMMMLTTACSLLTPLDELNAGSDGGSDGGGYDVVLPTTCTNGFACAANAPSGWSGPFSIYDGNPANVPTCSGNTPQPVLDAHADLGAIPPAQCAPTCACTPTIACGTSRVDGYCTNNCGMPPSNPASLNANSGTCYWLGLDCSGFYPASFHYGLAAATGGCAPSGGGMVTKPPLTWNRAEVGCQIPKMEPIGCPTNEVCVPSGPAPFEAKPCVMQAGDVACPGAPYSQKRVVYKNTQDARSCSACGCGALPAGDCSGTVQFFTNNSCNTPITGTYPLPMCQNAGGSTYLKIVATAPSINCPPSGGQPTGTVTPSEPVTICCVP